MNQANKVEVMDFIINILKDHEKNLDTLISRTKNMIEENQSPQTGSQNLPILNICLRNWRDFKELAAKAELICFDVINSVFFCEAVNKNKVYAYSEKLPELGINEANYINGPFKLGKMDIGLQLVVTKVIFSNDNDTKHSQALVKDIDRDFTKEWLSNELNINNNQIVTGIVINRDHLDDLIRLNS